MEFSSGVGSFEVSQPFSLKESIGVDRIETTAKSDNDSNSQVRKRLVIPICNKDSKFDTSSAAIAMGAKYMLYPKNNSSSSVVPELVGVSTQSDENSLGADESVSYTISVGSILGLPLGSDESGEPDCTI